MKYGFILMGHPTKVVELAQEAEAAGWDGVFLSDDWMTAWIMLAAIAMRTQRIHLGTMLTPLPEQLPWYVAAQTATLDHLSGGRVILTAGLGILNTDQAGSLNNKVRAERLDEALEILATRWRGEPLRTAPAGHYTPLQEMHSSVEVGTYTSQQSPRIPLWVIGGPKQRQLQRAARWDGAVIGASPEELRAQSRDRGSAHQFRPARHHYRRRDAPRRPRARRLHRQAICRGGSDLVAGEHVGVGRRLPHLRYADAHPLRSTTHFVEEPAIPA